MLRTADSYIEQYAKLRETKNLADSIIEIVNTARRELLEEASERATVTSSCSVWNCEGESVDKQSILNLIKELK